MDVDNVPLYESLFIKTYNVCQIFPALDPLTIREKKAREVFLLFKRTSKLNKYISEVKETTEKKKSKKKIEEVDVTGQPGWY